MKITLSKFAGFCGGVKRAYEMVMKLNMADVKQPVYVLGSLVHNEDVVKKIEEKGICKIDYNDFLEGNYKEIGTIIITAHGSGPEIYQLAKERDIDLVDATCPKVTNVQKLSNDFSEKNYEVIIIGDKDHKEVKGIFEWGGSLGKIISKGDELENSILDKEKRVVVISQTTQDEDFFEKISQRISVKYENVKIINTICLATKNRQEELKQIAEENEVVLVIGSPTSANSTRLYEIASSLNPRSYFIERTEDIQRDWLSEVNTIGISAGASTPSWVIEEVLKFLQE